MKGRVSLLPLCPECTTLLWAQVVTSYRDGIEVFDFSQIFTKFLLPKIYIFTYWYKLSLCSLNRDCIRERQLKFSMGHEKVVEEDSLVPVRKSHGAIGWRRGVGGKHLGRAAAKACMWLVDQWTAKWTWWDKTVGCLEMSTHWETTCGFSSRQRWSTWIMTSSSARTAIVNFNKWTSLQDSCIENEVNASWSCYRWKDMNIKHSMGSRCPGWCYRRFGFTPVLAGLPRLPVSSLLHTSTAASSSPEHDRGPSCTIKGILGACNATRNVFYMSHLSFS